MGDALLLLGVGGRALRQTRLEDRQRPRRDGPAVHALGQAVSLEDGQVAANRLAADIQLLGKIDDGQPAILVQPLGEKLLAFCGVHGAPRLVVE